MTRADDFIALHGVSVIPYYETKGIVDSYGDRAVTWAARDAEVAMIQPAWRMRRSQVFKGIAGAIDSSEYIGMLKSDTAVEAGDYLLVGAVKYAVEQIVAVTMFGDTSHVEAHLRIMTEG